jgi:hypothetical protein
VIQSRGLSAHLAQPDQLPRISYCANRSSALKQRESSPVSRDCSQVLLKIGTGTIGAASSKNWSPKEDGKATKGKGCDIGYALAASSCEGANSVEACTVTALDAITAFAVPNPNFSSQSHRFFQVRMPVELPLRADHSAYFGLAKFYLSQPFQPSTRVTLNIRFRVVNAAFQCKIRNRKRARRGCNLLTLRHLVNRRMNCSRFSKACSTGHCNDDRPPNRMQVQIFCQRRTLSSR